MGRNKHAVLAAGAEGEVSYSRVEELAEELGTSTRAVSSKLRSLGYEVAKSCCFCCIYSRRRHSIS